MSGFLKRMSVTMKAAAETTAAVATKAAKATADFTKEQYNNAVARPTNIKCESPECKGKIVVPSHLWSWTCANNECASSNEDVGKCAKCEAVRPKPNNPVINCPECQTPTTVYSSVAAQNTAEAARYTKQGAKDVAAWTQNKFVELKSRPTTVMCRMENCKLLLAVPPEVWEWQCEEKHQNEADARVCATCQAKRPSFTPVLTCQCGNQVMVPSTVAKAQLDQGVQYTKEQTKAVGVAAKTSYQHWTSAPEEFNCQHCNEKLHVPPPIFWNCVGCGQQNAPDLVKCSECSTKNKQEVMCGNCNQICTVPDSNLANAARSTKLSATKGVKDVAAAAKKLTSKEEKKDGNVSMAEAVPPEGAAPQ